jgi:hypothetical protein
MIVVLDGSSAAVCNADDLGSLSVHMRESSGAPAPIATPVDGDSEHVWLEIRPLQELAGRGRQADWGTRFESMIRYATDKGWVDPSGTRVRAHIERAEESRK